MNGWTWFFLSEFGLQWKNRQGNGLVEDSGERRPCCVWLCIGCLVSFSVENKWEFLFFESEIPLAQVMQILQRSANFIFLCVGKYRLESLSGVVQIQSFIVIVFWLAQKEQKSLVESHGKSYFVWRLTKMWCEKTRPNDPLHFLECLEVTEKLPQG